MGAFSSQVQPSQSSSPAGKSAGLSGSQMGQNPIQSSPQDQLMKAQPVYSPEMDDFGGSTGVQMSNPYQSNLDGAPNPNQSNLGGAPTSGKGTGAQGQITFPGQGGQPKIGMPNAYSNTIQPWDNQALQDQGQQQNPQIQPKLGGGKGIANGGGGSRVPQQMGKGAQ
jgi:hypothetical protein